MRRHFVLRTIRMRRPGPALVCSLVLAVFFLSGGLVGMLYSRVCDEASRSAFRTYLSDYCLLFDRGDVMISFPRCAKLYLGYSFGVFLLGFSSLGLVLIPALCVLFGFTSFYTVACFELTFGSSGVFLAASLISVRLLFTLPCFLVMASEALPLSLHLARLTAGRGKRVEPVSYSSRYFILFLCCCVVLLIGACCERLLMPALFRTAFDRLQFFF